MSQSSGLSDEAGDRETSPENKMRIGYHVISSIGYLTCGSAEIQIFNSIQINLNQLNLIQTNSVQFIFFFLNH